MTYTDCAMWFFGAMGVIATVLMLAAAMCDDGRQVDDDEYEGIPW